MAALHTEPLAQNIFADSMIRHILVKLAGAVIPGQQNTSTGWKSCMGSINYVSA